MEIGPVPGLRDMPATAPSVVKTPQAVDDIEQINRIEEDSYVPSHDQGRSGMSDNQDDSEEEEEYDEIYEEIPEDNEAKLSVYAISLESANSLNFFV
jgi:hypothetical protein